MSYSDIVNLHIKHCGEGANVVFDGYGAGSSTKAITHLRRSKGKAGRADHFHN